MNDQTPPTLPKPQPETIKALAPVWWKQKTTIALFVSAVTGLPELITQLFHTPGLPIPDALRPWLILTSVVCLWVAPKLAHWGGVNAAGRVAELPGNGGGVVPPQE